MPYILITGIPDEWEATQITQKINDATNGSRVETLERLPEPGAKTQAVLVTMPDSIDSKIVIRAINGIRADDQDDGYLRAEVVFQPKKPVTSDRSGFLPVGSLLPEPTTNSLNHPPERVAEDAASSGGAFTYAAAEESQLDEQSTVKQRSGQHDVQPSALKLSPLPSSKVAAAPRSILKGLGRRDVSNVMSTASALSSPESTSPATSKRVKFKPNYREIIHIYKSPEERAAARQHRREIDIEANRLMLSGVVRIRKFGARITEEAEDVSSRGSQNGLNRTADANNANENKTEDENDSDTFAPLSSGLSSGRNFSKRISGSTESFLNKKSRAPCTIRFVEEDSDGSIPEHESKSLKQEDSSESAEIANIISAQGNKTDNTSKATFSAIRGCELADRYNPDPAVEYAAGECTQENRNMPADTPQSELSHREELLGSTCEKDLVIARPLPSLSASTDNQVNSLMVSRGDLQATGSNCPSFPTLPGKSETEAKAYLSWAPSKERLIMPSCKFISENRQRIMPKFSRRGQTPVKDARTKSTTMALDSAAQGMQSVKKDLSGILATMQKIMMDCERVDQIYGETGSGRPEVESIRTVLSAIELAAGTLATSYALLPSLSVSWKVKWSPTLHASDQPDPANPGAVTTASRKHPRDPEDKHAASSLSGSKRSKSHNEIV